MPKADLNPISTTDIETPAAYVAELIATRLTRSLTVLWLVSGGSSMSVAVRTRELLDGYDLSRLYVGIIDERYGLPGHKESNWQQLLDAGFETAGLNSYPPLRADVPIDQTASGYGDLMQPLLSTTDYKVGLFGLGKDGHTAGLLPDNPLMDSRDCYGYYQASDFQRMSATPRLISRLDQAIVYAVGSSKWPALEKLLSDDPEAFVPARALNNAGMLRIFSDYKGGTT